MDGIVYRGMRIVIPPSLRKHIMSLIHKSHMGIVKSKSKAREVVYWPGMNTDIEEMVRNCSKCAEYQDGLPSEPSIVPDLPYTEVGTDIFEFNGKNFLITVDYYSKFIEVDELSDMRSTTVVDMLKSQFSNGAWPQRYPLPSRGYSRWYTFNDNAINDCIKVMLDAYNEGRIDRLYLANASGVSG